MQRLLLFYYDMDKNLKSMSSTFRHIGENIGKNTGRHFIYLKQKQKTYALEILSLRLRNSVFSQEKCHFLRQSINSK